MEALYRNYFRKNDDQNPILKALEHVPIFEDLSEKKLKNIARLTHERMYKKMNTYSKN